MFFKVFREVTVIRESEGGYEKKKCLGLKAIWVILKKSIWEVYSGG